MTNNKIKYLFWFVSLAFIGCSESKPKPVDADESRIKEDFAAFLDRFSSDSLFQKSRVDNPLRVFFPGSDSDTLQSMVVEKVYFNKEDWEGELEVSQAKISDDTFKVVVQIVDTGVFIEHYFALREGDWHLFEIKNLSD